LLQLDADGLSGDAAGQCCALVLTIAGIKANEGQPIVTQFAGA
jgi:hypothetical protein